jgi:hypothetical protein
MANLNLRFYNKQGDPLNLEYVGPTGSAPLDRAFTYRTNSQNSTPAQGYTSFLNLSSNIVYMNLLDVSGFDISSWVNNVNTALSFGSKISIIYSFAPAQTLTCVISSVFLTIPQFIARPVIKIFQVDIFQVLSILMRFLQAYMKMNNSSLSKNFMILFREILSWDILTQVLLVLLVHQHGELDGITTRMEM